jgi:hypothetical protein
MSTPAMKGKPGKRKGTVFYLGAGLLAALPAVALIWAAVERVQDAADRSH